MLFFKIEKLNFSYQKKEILKDINLSYDSKDFLSLIGPNGAGKSTLIKLILGLLDAKNSISFNINKSQIGYVPQHTLANPNFIVRVLDIVLMGLINRKKFGFYSKEDKEKALQALESVGMKDFYKQSITTLSGGEIQKVFIARALVSECKMLILDEPTASVDSKSSIYIFELLSKLHSKGIGIFLVSHDINLALAYSDKIAHLDKELFLHTNQKEQRKSDFLKHLYNKHSHFCDVEMSLSSCLCEEHA